MPEGDVVVCEVCGAKNKPGTEVCSGCGVMLRPTKKADAKVDKLLEELIEAPKAEGLGELDLDKEIVDDLLDSLLVEEAPKAEVTPAPVENFECPLCGTPVAADVGTCPTCGAQFAEIAEEAPGVEAPPRAPKPEPSAEPGAPAEEVKVSLSEGEVSRVGGLSGRLIDVVVGATIAALVAIFLGFSLYSWSAIASNLLGTTLFFVVAVAGLAAGFALFQISTSAIARGDGLVREGRYEDAIPHYDRAIRTGSRPGDAWTSKGVALKRLGRLDEALRCHNTALKIDPEDEIAWCNKGDIFFRAGNLDRAIECYDRAVEIRPKYAIAWNNKGAALARAGRFEQARDCHDRAIQLKPKYVAAWLNKGEVLVRLGQRDEAQQCLDRAKTLGA